jgi:hypothetical protein
MTILLIFQLLPLAVAQETSLNRRKNETVAQADRIFGERYTPVAGKPIRLFDKQTETRSPDAIIYLHGSSYVIELVFAADGTIAGILLRPESLLYSNYWGDVPSAVELSRAEMQWLVASANEMQPLGKATEIMEAPDGCFQSGPNLYCTDHYELASVRHYHLVRGYAKNATVAALKDIQILYRQSVNGIVEQVRVEGSQRQLKVGGQWYDGEQPGVETFDKAQIGSVVSLVTYGCTANEKACTALPEESQPTPTKQ